MILSCPSKTFLLGEYLALRGEPTLIACTSPRFSLQIQKGKGENPFHPKSPAGKLWSESFRVTGSWTVSFNNPWGAGGMGGSSAEFLLLWAGIQAAQSFSAEAQLDLDQMMMLKSYQSFAAQESGLVPSGADMMAQTIGAVAHFDRKQGVLSQEAWRFSTLSFVLLKTNHKVETHSHLAGLSEWNHEELLELTLEGIEAFKSADAPGFVRSVAAVGEELENLGFVDAISLEILRRLRADPRVLAAKGCGAMGADTLLVLTPKELRSEFCQAWSSQFAVLGTEDDLCHGISVDVVSSQEEVKL